MWLSIFHTVCFALLVLSSAHVNANEVVKLLREYNKLEPPSVQLDFAQFLQDLKAQENLKAESEHLNALIIRANTAKGLGVCQNILLDKLKFDLDTQKLRNKLVQDSLEEAAQYEGNVGNLLQGQQWYTLLTRWWLGREIPPSELKAIGEKALLTAREKITNIDGIHIKNPTSVSRSESRFIKDVFTRTQTQVMYRLEDFFGNTEKINSVTIEKSELGMQFPAPGYYNNNTFYFNPLKDKFNLSQVDWLYLHEAIPGHHYQQQVASKSAICTTSQMPQREMAFLEGWAAYVETYGKGLGLYSTKAKHAFALRWEALRAIRVVLDVVIHTEGWTDAEAEAYWLEHFPEGSDVMSREINRIRNWPMQVNTYVYGKHKIETLKQHLQAKQGDNFNLARFHKNVVSISLLPMASLDYYHELFAE